MPRGIRYRRLPPPRRDRAEAAMSRKHKKHTNADVNRLREDAEARFREFVAEHNAAVEERAEEEPETAAEDFAERYLMKMRRALGVFE